jgi:hypothetical protein
MCYSKLRTSTMNVSTNTRSNLESSSDLRTRCSSSVYPIHDTHTPQGKLIISFTSYLIILGVPVGHCDRRGVAIGIETRYKVHNICVVRPGAKGEVAVLCVESAGGVEDRRCLSGGVGALQVKQRVVDSNHDAGGV